MTCNFPHRGCSHIKLMTQGLNSLKGAQNVQDRISFSVCHLNSFPPLYCIRGILFYQVVSVISITISNLERFQARITVTVHLVLLDFTLGSSLLFERSPFLW